MSDELLRAMMIRMTNLELQYESAMARIAALENRPGKEALPFRERFPSMDTIVRFKAYLFENEPRQGVSRYVVKVGLWDRPEAREPAFQQKHPNGLYRNWCFPMQTREDYIARDPAWAEYDFPKEIWLGCATHKGNKRCKGTRQLLDHVALVNVEERVLLLKVSDEVVEFDAGKPLTSPKHGSPIHIWYLDA